MPFDSFDSATTPGRAEAHDTDATAEGRDAEPPDGGYLGRRFPTGDSPEAQRQRGYREYLRRIGHRP